ncbi:hypothetical protein ACH0BF_22225 [Pseudobacillus sp. 179-B 2D1 NHS]
MELTPPYLEKDNDDKYILSYSEDLRKEIDLKDLIQKLKIEIEITSY